MKLSQRKMSRPSLGGIVATRQGALAVALVCAISATGILLFALSRYRAGLHHTAPQATVLVATGAIPKGMPGSQIAARSLYRAMPVVASQLSPGALSDASSLGTEVTVGAILPGQQLTAADFTAAGGVTDELAPDQRAISLTVGEANGDTDVLAAGDRVDVYSQMAPAKSGNGPTEFLLLRGALVLQAPGGGAVSAATKSQSSNAGTLVLAITATQVPNVVYAAQNSALYLTVRPTNATRTPNSNTTQDTVIKASLNTSNTGAHP